MCPAYWVVLERFPQLPNGKIDRRRLPSPNPSRPDLDTPYVAPTNTIESQIAEFWAQALKIDRVGINDDFLMLGGNSLIAMSLASRVIDYFQLRIELSHFFTASTVKAMSLLVEQKRVTGIQCD